MADEQIQKILAGYQREVERLKTENREVRARGSVAERSYRAVMAENERLCNKLEHLEEIFVHQARQTPWPKEAALESKMMDEGKEADGSSSSSRDLLVRKLRAENTALQRRMERLER